MTTSFSCSADWTNWVSTAARWTASSRPLLEVAVTEFQRNAGLNVDGIVGETTIDRIRRLQKVGDERPAGQHPGPYGRLRRAESLSRAAGEHRSRPWRPGPGRPRAERDVSEKDVNLALGTRLADAPAPGAGRRCSCCGRATSICRSTTGRMPPTSWEPHIHICIHHAYASDPKARGRPLTTSRTRVYLSKAGKRLAGYLVDSLSRELGQGGSQEARPQLRLPSGG